MDGVMSTLYFGKGRTMTLLINKLVRSAWPKPVWISTRARRWNRKSNICVEPIKYVPAFLCIASLVSLRTARSKQFGLTHVSTRMVSWIVRRLNSITNGRGLLIHIVLQTNRHDSKAVRKIRVSKKCSTSMCGQTIVHFFKTLVRSEMYVSSNWSCTVIWGEKYYFLR